MNLAQRPFDGPRFGGDPGLSAEEAFETLSNGRRRHVVRRLLAEGDRIDIRTLSREVAAGENDKPVDRVSAAERHRVYNALQQFHLPKLDELGVVRYDSDRGVVESTDSIDGLETYLRAPERRDGRWASSVLVGGGVTGVAVTTLLAGQVPIPLYGALLGGLLGVFALGWYVGCRHLATRSLREEEP